MRTVINLVKSSSLCRQVCAKLPVYAIQVFFRQQSACNTRLIGDDEDFYAELVRFAYRLCGVREQPEVIWAGKKINLRINGAVAVEENTDIRKELLFNVGEAPYTS